MKNVDHHTTVPLTHKLPALDAFPPPPSFNLLPQRPTPYPSHTTHHALPPRCLASTGPYLKHPTSTPSLDAPLHHPLRLRLRAPRRLDIRASERRSFTDGYPESVCQDEWTESGGFGRGEADAEEEQ